ncbi:hypothetical protein EJ04DRAFT_7115 [Polyplosphaeria fusca]|uniref:Uncharacterized protein n=1 Tax=Polyplosphaeria fusca TaxID=682080 RepID=A0A9P4R909_9PLEO|nr:hypothetical protein EJ04DRAFT_7115 [Polyplosphaeria fusca]
MANLDRSTIPDQLLEVHQAIARGNMDHIFDQIPKVDELHFEPMSKETSKILSGKGTLLDHRLFLGEGDNWSAWAYVRCLNQRTEVAIRVVQNKRNIVTYKATSILDMSRFRLMYPFQALNKNNAQNEQRQLKLLIQYYFLEGRFADRIFSNQNNYLVLLSGLRIVEMCYMDLPGDPNNISHNLLAPYRPRPKQRPFDRSAGSEEPEPMDSQDTPMTGMPTSRTEEAVP